MPIEPELLVNRILTPDGTILESKHRWDYVNYLDANGEMYMVDGGVDYQRVSVNKEPYKDLSLYTDSPFEEIRKHLKWGVNYDKDMNRLPSTEWTPICDLSTEHIQAILDNGYGSNKIRKCLETELAYRNIQK